MNMHDAWRSPAEPATGDQLQMDEPTARQLADELTTLASSMFGLLQPHPGADPAQAESEAAFETALADSMPVADPASVVSVAIPVEPVVAAESVEAPESWTPESAEAAADEIAEPPAALAVPALAVPGVPAPEDPDRRASLTVLNEIAFLDE